MTFSQKDTRLFQGILECTDLGDLADSVAEGIRAFQRATPTLTKHTRLDALSIELKEVVPQ